MTAATRHIHGFRSYITSGALNTISSPVQPENGEGDEGLNVRIRGTSGIKVAQNRKMFYIVSF